MKVQPRVAGRSFPLWTEPEKSLLLVGVHQILIELISPFNSYTSKKTKWICSNENKTKPKKKKKMRKTLSSGQGKWSTQRRGDSGACGEFTILCSKSSGTARQRLSWDFQWWAGPERHWWPFNYQKSDKRNFRIVKNSLWRPCEEECLGKERWVRRVLYNPHGEWPGPK